MGTQFRTIMVDGRKQLVSADPPPPAANPPLGVLNQNYRAHDEERRDETNSVVTAASLAMTNALSGRNAQRRTQKPLRPVIGLAKG